MQCVYWAYLLIKICIRWIWQGAHIFSASIDIVIANCVRVGRAYSQYHQFMMEQMYISCKMGPFYCQALMILVEKKRAERLESFDLEL